MSALETVRSFYELFAVGKTAEALEAYVALDVTLENPLPDPIPFGGTFEGRDGFAQYLSGILEGIQIEAFEVDEILVDGERVVVLGRETSQVRASGRRYTMNWVHVLTVRDDRVTFMREYNDTAAMRAAFV